MITKCKVVMRNCYGIPALDHEFLFTHKKKKSDEPQDTIVAIYAPNGLMKTSMADSFKNYSAGEKPKDRVYTERESEIVILDQNGELVPNDAVFVVDSIDDGYKSKRISTLLASESLKAEYDEAYRAVGEKSDALLKSLKEKMKMRKDVDKIFIEDLGRSGESFVTALGSVERQVKDDSYLKEFANVSYRILFTDKNVNELMNDAEFKKLISQYSDVYKKLLDESRFFKQGVFNHTKATDVAKNLTSNGWFEGGHSVKLKSKHGDDLEDITDEETLRKYIDDEKNRILTDPTLEEMFAKIDKKFTTGALQEFRDHLLEHRHVIAEMVDVSALKRKICTAYLTEMKAEYTSLMAEYDECEEKINGIVERAKAEATRWESVIAEFNDRFSVPFEVKVTNKSDAVLSISGPQVDFVFSGYDGKDVRPIESNELVKVLSNGERRALYILNIIFEVNARMNDEQDTLIVFDDIADSFDYKNKYAIIEYLHEISMHGKFRMIILTHNFDFYRTIKSRLFVSNKCRLTAERSDDEIILKEDSLGDNPFLGWVKELRDPKSMIGCIPFVRNIAEYTGEKEVKSELTKLLHITKDSDSRKGSESITFKQVRDAFKCILTNELMAECYDSDQSVMSKIEEICDEIVEAQGNEVELLDKIVLSMGIRLEAERFLIDEISRHDPNLVEGLKNNQTGELIGKFSKIHKNNREAKHQVEVVKRVGLMTPENIHLNSFMFEPILDMSPEHLKKLYRDIKIINSRGK